MSGSACHLIWDWNGTLFDDQAATLRGVQAMCSQIGLPGISHAEYRRRFRRPIRDFFGDLRGCDLLAEEWRAASSSFSEEYFRHLATCELAGTAVSALQSANALGFSQSLLSLWEHELLLKKVRAFGIADYFVEVLGASRYFDGSKDEHLRRHVRELARTHGAEPDRAVVIGDCVDDGHAAREVGVACVLVSSGVNDEAALASTDWPIVGGPQDAVSWIAGLASAESGPPR